MLNQLLDFLLPPLCPGCQMPTQQHHHLCSTCWQKLNFIGHPACDICGFPLPFESPLGSQCATCLQAPPLFTMARSVVRYDEGSKPLILRFKHGDRLDLAKAFGPWLERTIHQHQLLDGIDAIVPVPLHWKRLFWRQYNQAGILGQYLAQHCSTPFMPQWLKRIKATPSQGAKTATQRKDNVRNVFKAHPDVKDKRILLIDDVFTTGATITECARALVHGKTKEIRVLTLARVVKGD